MNNANRSNWLFHTYMIVFLAYMLLPLVVMGGAAFNDSRFPSIYPWVGFTDRWFVELFQDGRMWLSFRNTIFVAIAVVAISVPIGTAAAILINSLGGTTRSLLYGLMVAPVLTPGAVIGISTLLFWNKIGSGLGLNWWVFSAGLHLSALGQASFISAFVMLLVLARLQSFDRTLEEAALDLGASYTQVMRRILLPHLYPAIGAGAAIAFFQSVENFNVTLFTKGTYDTLTVYVFSKVRSGITPTINALALILIAVTIVGAIWYETRRRRNERRLAAIVEPA
ncbi:MAG: ABC transporter permease [Rhizobiales bacterium]|nr:ABC transporter permease [Hyphomicrobiales bacterium]MBI3671963.1 ABC transporter permease [Hyphomicrobiales bacterium]